MISAVRPHRTALTISSRGEISNPPPNKHLILNYVSDPAGNGQFDGEYGAAQEGSPTFKLERYQLVTDESTHKL